MSNEECKCKLLSEQCESVDISESDSLKTMDLIRLGPGHYEIRVEGHYGSYSYARVFHCPLCGDELRESDKPKITVRDDALNGRR